MPVTIKYRVVWFPPDAEKRSRIFPTVEGARSFVRHGEQSGYLVREWNPLLVEETITAPEERIIPLEDPTEGEES